MAVAKRNRLMPWYIGLVVVVAGVAYTAYQMFVTGCEAPPIVQAIVLLVVPGGLQSRWMGGQPMVKGRRPTS